MPRVFTIDGAGLRAYGADTPEVAVDPKLFPAVVRRWKFATIGAAIGGVLLGVLAGFTWGRG